MSTDTPTQTDSDTDDRPDAYARFRAVAREAADKEIPAGPGRAAWVITQWDDRTPGQSVMMQPMGRYSAGAYRCDECGREPEDHPGTALILPSEDAPTAGAGVMAAPYCPRCALRLLRESLA